MRYAKDFPFMSTADLGQPGFHTGFFADRKSPYLIFTEERTACSPFKPETKKAGVIQTPALHLTKYPSQYPAPLNITEPSKDKMR